MTTSITSLHKTFPEVKSILPLLIISTILLFLGLYLPIITLQELFFFKSTFSMITGISALFHEKHVMLGIIILLFSVVFPIVKLAGLVYIWLFDMTDEKRKDIIKWMAKLSKWSMLDVFVVALTIIIAKLSGFADAYARIGIYFFAASVILTMYVSAKIENIMNRTG